MIQSISSGKLVPNGDKDKAMKAFVRLWLARMSEPGANPSDSSP